MTDLATQFRGYIGFLTADGVRKVSNAIGKVRKMMSFDTLPPLHDTYLNLSIASAQAELNPEKVAGLLQKADESYHRYGAVQRQQCVCLGDLDWEVLGDLAASEYGFPALKELDMHQERLDIKTNDWKVFL